MKINIKVIVNAKKQKVTRVKNDLRVYLKAKPEKGKANKELMSLLALYFDVSKNSISIIKGAHSRNKVIEV